MSKKVSIRRLATGVPGLDNLLGGGLPEFSFNLIAGTPGSGKTTLAQQIMFSLANPKYRALFFTVLGEPALKMLRYQQQFTFFDPDKVNDSIRFVNLSAELQAGDFDRVLTRITDEVKAYAPSLVFVDSFRSVVQSAKREDQSVSDLERHAWPDRASDRQRRRSARSLACAVLIARTFMSFSLLPSSRHSRQAAPLSATDLCRHCKS